jgi:hypothetical protein
VDTPAAVLPPANGLNLPLRTAYPPAPNFQTEISASKKVPKLRIHSIGNYPFPNPQISTPAAPAYTTEETKNGWIPAIPQSLGEMHMHRA